MQKRLKLKENYSSNRLLVRHPRRRKYLTPSTDLIGSSRYRSTYFPANHWRPPATAAPPPAGAISPGKKKKTAELFFFNCALWSNVPCACFAAACFAAPPPSCSGCGFKAAGCTFWSGQSEMHPRSAQPVPSRTQSLWNKAVFFFFFFSSRLTRRADDAQTCRGIISKATKSAAASSTSFSDSTSCFG